MNSVFRAGVSRMHRGSSDEDRLVSGTNGRPSSDELRDRLRGRKLAQSSGKRTLEKMRPKTRSSAVLKNNGA